MSLLKNNNTYVHTDSLSLLVSTPNIIDIFNKSKHEIQKKINYSQGPCGHYIINDQNEFLKLTRK